MTACRGKFTMSFFKPWTPTLVIEQVLYTKFLRTDEPIGFEAL